MQKKIAITGGIGSGKSFVLRYIADLGYPTFSCDEIYKDIIDTEEYVNKIATVFPTCVENQILDRKKLSNIVFGDEKKLKILNSIAHPLIMRELLGKMSACPQSKVFAEVPLLFEGNFEVLFDEVILVKRSLQERIEAIKIRDKLSSPEIYARIQNQVDYDSRELELRLQNCNAHILYNSNFDADFKERIQSLLLSF